MFLTIVCQKLSIKAFLNKICALKKIMLFGIGHEKISDEWIIKSILYVFIPRIETEKT